MCLRLIFFSLILQLSFLMFGQTSFQRTIGTVNNESVYSFAETDNGYLFAGTTNGAGAGGDDILIVETDFSYNIQKSITLGGPQNDFPRSVIKCVGGGYAIIGSTYSYGAGSEEIILIKLSQALDLEWVKTYGGSNLERGFCILEDGSSFVIGATTKSGDGALVIKTDQNGNIDWSKTYGFDENSARCFSVVKTDNGNFLFTGPFQQSSSSYDFMTIEVNASGGLVSANAFVAGGNDHTRDIIRVDGDGYYVLGHSKSFGNGSWDLLLVKIDLNGSFQWAKNFGNINDLWASQLIMTSDNHLLITGHNGLFSEYSNDIIVLKCDKTGNLIWSKSYGGSNVENQMFGNHETIFEINSGSYLSMGRTSSFGAGGQDIYLMGFDDQGSSDCNFHELSISETSVHLQSQSISLPVKNYNPTITQPNLQISVVNLEDSMLCISTTPPVAGFSASGTELCVGECVDFADLSTNQPDEWMWYFEGGTQRLQFYKHL